MDHQSQEPSVAPTAHWQRLGPTAWFDEVGGGFVSYAQSSNTIMVRMSANHKHFTESCDPDKYKSALRTLLAVCDVPIELWENDVK